MEWEEWNGVFNVSGTLDDLDWYKYGSFAALKDFGDVGSVAYEDGEEFDVADRKRRMRAEQQVWGSKQETGGNRNLTF